MKNEENYYLPLHWQHFNAENTEFDVSNMGSGMYLVRILDANGAISTRRLIIY